MLISSASADPSASAPGPPFRSSIAATRSMSPSDKPGTPRKHPNRRRGRNRLSAVIPRYARDDNSPPISLRQLLHIPAEVIARDRAPVDRRCPEDAFLQKAAARRDDCARQHARSFAASQSKRQVVVLHDRDLAKAAELTEDVAADELGLISPRTMREHRSGVD